MNGIFCYGKNAFCFNPECSEKCPHYTGTGVAQIDVQQHRDNPYWERICRLSDRQRANGMQTYGQGLESNPAPILARLNHLEEELIDGLMYIEWIKEKIMEGTKQNE